MKSNLPVVKKEGIFSKISNWIKKLFKKEKIIIKEPLEDVIKEINNSVEEIKKTDFKESLQVKSKDNILALQRKLKEKQIEISDLTDQELDEMIELYKEQIEEKKNKLRQYKKQVMNKKEEIIWNMKKY